MSYIVPREKPNRCTNCPFMDRITYDCMLMYGDDYPDFETQYKNCPLVEIPTPHGNLKDESDIISLIEVMFCKDKDGMEHAIQCIKDAPTVIEAEGEKDGR